MIPFLVEDDYLSRLPNLRTNTRLLQVFVYGKACGWLGHSPQGYWFHYGSARADQAWVSLLMPPSQTLYMQAALFPVFRQLLPEAPLRAQVQARFEHLALNDLDLLFLLSPLVFGAWSFANPDLPVVLQARHRVLRSGLQLNSRVYMPENQLSSHLFEQVSLLTHAGCAHAELEAVRTFCEPRAVQYYRQWRETHEGDAGTSTYLGYTHLQGRPAAIEVLMLEGL